MKIATSLLLLLAVPAMARAQEGDPCRPVPGYDVTDASFVPISFLLLFGIPIGVGEHHPRGLLRPYFGGGPSMVPASFHDSGGGGAVTALGFDLRAGLAVQFSPQVSIFGEYRGLWASGSDEQHRTDYVWGFFPEDQVVGHSQLDMSAQFAVFGLAIHLQQAD